MPWEAVHARKTLFAFPMATMVLSPAAGMAGEMRVVVCGLFVASCLW